MRATVTAVLLVILGVSTAVAQRKRPGKPPTPAERYKTLLKQYRLAASSGKVLTDAERLKFVGKVYRLRNRLAMEMIVLVEKHPRDPFAIDALMQATWLVNNTPWPVELIGQDTATPKALALLQRDHIRSAKLRSVCRRLAWGYRWEYETFLRAVLAKNPHKEVQAEACLGLAHFLNNRVNRVDLVRELPKQAKEFANLFGKAYLDVLLKQDRGKALREAESFFERAAKQYSDVKLTDVGTVGEQAKRELFEIRHLSVGRPAPDIAGKDQDGKPFKLSDYRGKVVLLDFWSEY